MNQDEIKELEKNGSIMVRAFDGNGNEIDYIIAESVNDVIYFKSNYAITKSVL
jgi:hypothetical protein